MRTIGALALAIGFMIMGGSALASGDQVCPDLDSGKIDEPGNKTKVTVTAPDGQLIDQYCAKAGSAKQGNGPELVTVDPPQKSVTISHSSGKDLSHYSVSYVADPNEPNPQPSEEPSPEPTDDPTPQPDEECEEEEEGDEEGEDEGEEGEEDEEECEEPAPEQTTPPATPPTTPPATQTTTTPAQTQPVTQPVVVTPVVTEPAPKPKPLPDTEVEDEVKGIVVTRSDAEEALPATLAYTGPRDQLPFLWTLAGMFIATGLVLQLLGRRRAKQSTTW